MEFFEVVKKRQSYRAGFKDQRIPQEDLRKIVQAGLDAPSGCNGQTTTFVIVDDPDLLGRIGKMHKAMRQVRAFIACIVDKDPPPVIEDLNFQVEDCAAAVENMLLAITALGYASVWVDGWLRREGRGEALGKLLGLPEGKIVRVLLPVGMPSEEYKRPAKKPFEERAWFNGWGKEKA